MEKYALISVILNCITLLGLVIALLSYVFKRRTTKAQFIHSLNNEYFANKIYLEIFNKIEWKRKIDVTDEKYYFEIEGFLAFFDYITYLYFQKIIKEEDFNIFRYMLKRIIECEDIKNYFKKLEDFSNSNNINFAYMNLKKFSELNINR